MAIGQVKDVAREAGALRGFVDPAVLLARAFMAYIFVVEGYGKLFNYSDVSGYMQSHGVPSALLPLVILTELGGGLLVLGGLMTRWAAIALAGFTLLTAFIFHNNGADAEQTINFQKNFAIAGGFLVLAAFGPGAWSLDRLLAQARSQGAGPG
jgi:putative oxidoreductase